MSTEHAPDTRTCRAHPGVETRLSCSNCGAPICPRCMVATPVGQKCPECARHSGRARGTPTTPLLGKVFAAALATGAAGAVVMTLFGFPFVFILGALYGYAVGSVARRAAGGRAQTALGVVTVAGLVIALVVVLLVLGANPLDARVLLVALIGGAVSYLRAAGIW